METTEIEDRVARVKARTMLDWYEGEIRKRIRSLGEIFLQLRKEASQPWRFEYASCDEYCQKVWGMTDRRAQQLAAGENTRALLLESAPEMAPAIQTLSEAHMREISTVPTDKRIPVLRAAIEAVKDPAKRPTAKLIRKARALIVEGVVIEDKPCVKCPHCNGTGKIPAA